MLPTFVIGLREGLGAAVIVGIIAAFLRQQGRPALVRQVGYGVALAVAGAAGHRGWLLVGQTRPSA